MIDTNVSLGRWPFRHLPCDEPSRLAEKLQVAGVTEAWAGSFDGLFHRDIAGVNERLAADCRRASAVHFRPFGTVNPLLPDWRDDLRRCHETHRMPGIRLHPNYHGYALDHPAFDELLTLAAKRHLVVQLAVRVEDVRVHHPLMRVADVDVAPLADLVAQRAELQLVLLNALQVLGANAVRALAATGRVAFEISTLEGIEGISRVLRQIPVELLLLGSHCPFFVVESALLKLRESELTAAERQAISHANARRLCPGAE